MRNLFKLGRKSSSHDTDDLGLSSQVMESDQRILNKDGNFNIDRKGERDHIYHTLISMSWWSFLGYVFLFFTLINGGFALVYLLFGIENIAGVEHESFLKDLVNMFHFSVQTMTTVGYGHMYPTSTMQSVVASLHALVGLLTFALATGLVYGRFSNPRADIKYSQNILIAEHATMGKTLQVRLANRLSHDLLQADARLLMLHNKEKGKQLVKQYVDLKLELSHIYFLPLNWTLVHKIDESSPLFNKSNKDIEESGVEFLVLISAFDDTFSQMVYSRTSYTHAELVENAKWDLAYSMDKQGKRVFDISKLDNYTIIDDAKE